MFVVFYLFVCFVYTKENIHSKLKRLISQNIRGVIAMITMNKFAKKKEKRNVTQQSRDKTAGKKKKKKIAQLGRMLL